jgi:hypothetical protein
MLISLIGAFKNSASLPGIKLFDPVTSASGDPLDCVVSPRHV